MSSGVIVDKTEKFLNADLDELSRMSPIAVHLFPGSLGSTVATRVEGDKPTSKYSFEETKSNLDQQLADLQPVTREESNQPLTHQDLSRIKF